MRPIRRIFPSLGSNGKNERTFPSSVTYVFYVASATIPLIALISHKVFKEAFIFATYGIVGKGNANTSGIPIVFNCRRTDYRGNLHIYGKGYSSIIFAYNAEEYRR